MLRNRVALLKSTSTESRNVRTDKVSQDQHSLHSPHHYVRSLWLRGTKLERQDMWLKLRNNQKGAQADAG